MGLEGQQRANDAVLFAALFESCLVHEGEVGFVAEGRSMMPLIRAQDKLVVRRLLDGEPRTGDVVAVRRVWGESILVHRVVGLTDEGCFLICGDNRSVDNGEFTISEILGIVTRVERKGRSVWFGAGRLGRLVSWAVRHGLIRWPSRVHLAASRLADRALELLSADFGSSRRQRDQRTM